LILQAKQRRWSNTFCRQCSENFNLGYFKRLWAL